MVGIVLRGPAWFFGIGWMFEAFAAIVLLLIFLMSCRAYRFTKLKTYKNFTIAFGILAVAFIARAFTDFAINYRLISMTWLAITTYFLHIGLSLTAFLCLAYVASKAKEKKGFVIAGILTMAILPLARNYLLAFNIVAMLLLGYIVVLYFENYVLKKKLSSLLVFGGFVLLLLAQLFFVIDIMRDVLYIAAHLVQVLGFVLLLAALALIVLKK